jgi:16S rRNA (cytosine967-C5)-methyltransferase
MTPGARIAAAIEILETISTQHRPVAEALKDWGTSHRFAGSGDRAAIGNIVYDALRRRRSIAWAMDSDAPRALAIGAVAFCWVESGAAISAMLESPHSPEAMTQDELTRLDRADFAKARDTVRADVPDWVAPSLARSLGGEWVEEMRAVTARPPLDIRVNRLKADRAKVAQQLVKSKVVETRFSPDGLRVPPTEKGGRHPALQAEPGFRKGWFEIQDEGSQIAALCVGAKPGEQVLDLCAGGGGKTLALAAMMENKGQIHATDSDKHRLAPIFDRLKRAGTRNVQVIPAGGEMPFAGKMDRVLIDAPCTGSGTWRRHPDAKWRLTEDALARRTAEQAALLRQAAGFVRPGGLLMYVTCSLLAEENEDQVASFLDQTSEFSALSTAELLAGAGLPKVAAEELAQVAASPRGLLMTPHRTGTDGFFIAAMRRSG